MKRIVRDHEGHSDRAFLGIFEQALCPEKDARKNGGAATDIDICAGQSRYQWRCYGLQVSQVVTWTPRPMECALSSRNGHRMRCLLL